MIAAQTTCLCVPLAVIAGFGLAGPICAADSFTLVAERTLRPDGTLVTGLAVVIDDAGQISRIALAESADLPAPVRRFGAHSVIAPGLHELLSTLGAPGENVETVRAIDLEADAMLAVDPLRRDLDRARAGGVLVATVAPSPRNPVCGRAITFATGARADLARIGSGPGTLVLAVGESALDALRAPTSRSGLRHTLSDWLAGPDAPRPDDGATPLVFCDEAMDIRTALDLFAGRSPPTLVLTGEYRECASALSRIERRPSLVVVGPLGAETDAADLRGVALLPALGLEIAFRGAMPSEGETSLRETAHRAVQHGLGAAAARRGITVNSARAVGLADQIGSIETGRRADLVVYSGDPLLPGSVVVAIYQEGAEVPIPASAPPRIPEMEETR